MVQLNSIFIDFYVWWYILVLYDQTNVRIIMGSKYSLKQNILYDLKNHKGHRKFKMKELGIRYGVSTRLIRESINSLRVEDNQPICGDNTGYYFPVYKSEWEHTSNRLKAQAKSLFEAAAGGDKFYKKDDQEALF